MKLINGNHKEYHVDPPLIVIQSNNINEVALDHVFKNTGLKFVKTGWGYEAQPHNFEQIAALFLTYNFKTRYFNNADQKNTLMLKFDHHTGFDVDHICYDCAAANHINTSGIVPGDRLAC